MRYGPYELREKFGAGGMGDIWIGVHSALGRPAAIKVIRPDALGGGHGESLLSRFEREAKATSALRSPHTIEIYDFGITDDGVFYYAMEFLEGCNLQTLVEHNGPVHASRACWILRQVCDSLEEAHRAGLVHRDIKPANIHLCKLGLKYDFAKVLDFGLVKADGDAQLTDANLVHGTPAFMPPEILHGASSLDARADIYALGCVAYWLVTGQLVFEAETPMAVVMKHMNAEPVPPSRRVELRVPPDFEAIVMQCLEKEPEKRPQSAAELSKLLSACDYDPPWTEDDAEAWWLTHSPQSWAAVDVVGGPSKTLGSVAPVQPPSISVAVLPFENRSNDPEQQYFSDGVAEDIIVELGRFKALTVTARSSSFAFRDSPASIAEIARDLSVRYIVQGSVRRIGDRIRLSVELADGRACKQLWAERYDRDVDDLFDVQEDVVQRIVATIAGRLESQRIAEAKKKPPSSLDAYDCLLRGLEAHHKHTPEAEEEAWNWFQRAAELDPDLAPAYAMEICAFVGTDRCERNPDGFPVDSGPQFDYCMDKLDRAFELDPAEPEVNRILGDVSMYFGELEKAQFYLERGVTLNPNNDRLICTKGELQICLGDYDGAIQSLQRAMAINPFHPPRWWGHLARALHLNQQCAESLAAFKRLPSPNRVHLAYMVACASKIGRDDDAARFKAKLLELDPDFSTAAFVAKQRLQDRQQADQLSASLIAAGLPK